MRAITRIFLIIALAALMGQTRPAREMSMPSQAGTLAAMETRLRNGQAAAVAKEIDPQLLKYNSTDMPVALYLRGKARIALAPDAKDEEKKDLLLGAALDFMRVVTYYPYWEYCDDALASAQKALADAGDAQGAMAVAKLIAQRADNTDR